MIDFDAAWRTLVVLAAIGAATLLVVFVSLLIYGLERLLA